ncbi:Lin0512 family protein [uncultured Oscillibacter sp.]|uniref:Lin0512 family protein n=1 Tax=uncultured Oscillibacter sp. TaxID=876091 RepID=UPI0025FBC2C6|nr:Lin0512 family protein [uncultured Oscillibacter sp.]
MGRQRYLIEIGTGVDLHGGDVTNAARKAVKDALSHCCMAGVREIHGAGPERIALRVQISCPCPEKLDLEQVREPVSFYEDVEVVPVLGGAAEKGLHVASMGAGDTLVVAVAIITVYLKD